MNSMLENQPLWVVYGADCFPAILCCKVVWGGTRANPGQVIWGYSVYKGVPGFRTLGIKLSTWMERSDFMPRFYTDQELALQDLRKLTTPKKKALEAMEARDA